MELNKEKTDINFNKSVKDRLLDSAEELFCENGFEGASIRDIAALAGCNIASVNYYFGGKQQLYEEVWRRHLIPMRDMRISSIEKVMSQSEGTPNIEDIIKSFADTFVGSMVDTEKTSRLSKLMAREYIDKHLPTDMFIDEIMMPTVTAIQKALVQTFPDLDESKISFVVFSLIGQLVHVVHVRTMFEHSGEESTRELFSSPEVINHIIKFTCAGIRAYI